MTTDRQEADPIVLEGLDDPWGNPYVVHTRGGWLRVISWGPDSREATEDDIVFPAKDGLPIQRRPRGEHEDGGR